MSNDCRTTENCNNCQKVNISIIMTRYELRECTKKITFLNDAMCTKQKV